MRNATRAVIGVLLAVIAVASLLADGPPPGSSSYVLDDNPVRLPESMNEGKWRQVSGIGFDPKGNLYVLHKCFSDTCIDRSESPILKFDATGKFLRGLGERMIPSPHGLYVDRQGFVWATDSPVSNDSRRVPGKGHQVFKFSPEGKLLLTLGTAGVPGVGPDTFNGPAAVAVAANGDIYVADGHGNNRVVKFTKTGKFVKAWGKEGSGPGEFRLPHSIAVDSRGRVLVGDRLNLRIQIFDPDGNFLEEWKQFGRPDGMFIAPDDTLYVSDANAEPEKSGGLKRGVRIGSVRDGSVKEFLEDPAPDPGSGAEFVTADSKKNVYIAAIRAEFLKRYVRK